MRCPGLHLLLLLLTGCDTSPRLWPVALPGPVGTYERRSADGGIATLTLSERELVTPVGRLVVVDVPRWRDTDFISDAVVKARASSDGSLRRAADCIGSMTITGKDVQLNFSAPRECEGLNGTWVRKEEAAVLRSGDECRQWNKCYCDVAITIEPLDGGPVREKCAHLEEAVVVYSPDALMRCRQMGRALASRLVTEKRPVPRSCVALK